MQITNYKCPACGGPLRFDEKSGADRCDYCGSEFTPEEIELFYKDKDTQAAAAARDTDDVENAEAYGDAAKPDSFNFKTSNSSWSGEESAMRFYSCPSCGAQLMLDATTAAAKCPYCGNPTVVPGQFDESMKPDFIIPFEMTQDEAKEKLRHFYKGKPFLPKSFVTQNTIDEIQGVYVPFWLYSGTADAAAQYKATRSFTVRQGDWLVTTTNHFIINRAGTIPFEKVPADGSKKMPDEYMDSIEPFDYSKMKAFSTAYLPGFVAHKYDVTSAENEQRVDTRLKNSAISILRDTVLGYETVTPIDGSVQVQDGSVNYALLPVWMLHTKWNGEDYLFAMNGQTGKMVSNLPMSWGRFFAKFFLIAVPASVLATLVVYFLFH